MSKTLSKSPARRKTVRQPDDATEGKARSPVAPGQDDLPDAAALAGMLDQIREGLADPRFDAVRRSLHRLSVRPPQVLLLEGGGAEDRFRIARYWALLLNCRRLIPAGRSQPDSSLGLPGILSAGQSPDEGKEAGAEDSGSRAVDGSDGQPCLECPECVRMAAGLHRDYFLLDGTTSSIKIDQVREVRSILGEPPREAHRRVVIFREAQALVEAAANALLKSLEEPAQGTCFVLLAPQRERLLPTLVSRSLTLTLPWPGPSATEKDDVLVSWEAALCVFLNSGKGWFAKTGARGAVDPMLVHSLINLCRQALAARLRAGDGPFTPEEGLQSYMSMLPLPRLRMVDEALAECQDSLILNVNPTLVLEWLATRLFLLLPRGNRLR